LVKLKGQVEGLEVRDYRKSAKRNHIKISNAKSADKREALFKQQLCTFTACINQVDEVVRNAQKQACRPHAWAVIKVLEDYLPTFRRVYDMAYRKVILKQKVENADKLVSIFEQHSDIISKGGREVQFGHKVSLCTGASNLIMDAQVLEGNPADNSLLAEDIARIKQYYGRTPRDAAFDGGYATKANLQVAQRAGIVNIVFSKVKGSMQNVVSSKHMATRLKKWRNGIEANISNLKRGFDLRVCTWKGEAHFRAKFMWSVIGYNIRVMTRLVVAQMPVGG
jgi:IS5 family transposase